MFKCETNQIKTIKSIFNAITNIVDEISIECDNEGMRLRALDRSHITFINLELNNTFFDTYTCDTPTKINLDTSELTNILKRSKNNDLMLWTIDEDEGNFIIKYKSEEVTRQFSIRLIDLDYESPIPPSINHPVTVTIPFNTLKTGLGDVSLFSEKVLLECDNTYFRINGDGDFGSTSNEYLHCDNVTTDVSSLYNIDKINDMLRADNINDNVTICLGDQLPLKLTITDNYEDVTLSYLLAPRIETDEEVY